MSGSTALGRSTIGQFKRVLGGIQILDAVRCLGLCCRSNGLAQRACQAEYHAFGIPRFKA